MTATFDQTKPANVTFVTSGYNTPSSSYGGMYKNGSQAYLNCNTYVTDGYETQYE